MSNSESGADLAHLAGEALAIDARTLPDAIRRQANLCVLDTVGCIIAGARTREAELMLACEPPSADGMPLRIPGLRETRPLRSALRIAGYLGDVLELNDLIGGHASIGNVTLALALGQERDAPGTKVLEAVVRGIEVTARVYASVYPTLKRFSSVGMMPVGLPAAIGSAAVAAHLLDLDRERTGHAMAIAGALSGWCPAEVIFGEGGSVKPMLFGAQTAQTGLDGALYARAGMTGPMRLLESKVGYFATASHAGAYARDDWAGRWALAEPRRKLHACCGYIHAPIDLLSRMRIDDPARLAGGLVEVRVPPYVAEVVAKDRLPVSPNDARFHLQYCLAHVLAGVDVFLPEHSIEMDAHLRDPALVAAMAQISVVADERFSHYHQCEIAVRDASAGPSAASFTRMLSSPRGTPRNPLSDQEVVDKFLRLSGPVVGDAAAERFVERTLALHEAAGAREWIGALG